MKTKIKSIVKKKSIKKKLTPLALIKKEFAILRSEKNYLQKHYNALNYHRGAWESNFVVMKQTIAEQAQRIKDLENKIINS